MSSSPLLRRVALPALPLVLQAVSTAEAQVVYTNPMDATVTASGTTIWFDVDGDAGGNAVRSDYFAGSDFAIYLQNSTSAPYALGNNPDRFFTQSAGFFATAVRYTAGDFIDGSTVANFAGFLHSGANANDWDAGDTGFLGLRLSTGADHFGWAQITYGLDGSLTLHDFAYELSPNTPIQAGAVPEPAATAAIAGLLAGSAALYYRRRRANDAPNQPT